MIVPIVLLQSLYDSWPSGAIFRFSLNTVITVAHDCSLQSVQQIL